MGERGHWELSRSDAAAEYVWKEDTEYPGLNLNSDQDHSNATPVSSGNNSGNTLLLETSWRSPRTYEYVITQLSEESAKTILHHMRWKRTCHVFIGPTGTGKSRKAWMDAGMDSYPKDPNTKFWCGYVDQEHVVIDEFRGRIDISHLLRWLDRYPVNVELKGSSIPLRAKTIWGHVQLERG